MTVDELRERLEDLPGHHEVLGKDGRPIEEVRQRTDSAGPAVVLR